MVNLKKYTCEMLTHLFSCCYCLGSSIELVNSTGLVYPIAQRHTFMDLLPFLKMCLSAFSFFHAAVMHSSTSPSQSCLNRFSSHHAHHQCQDSMEGFIFLLLHPLSQNLPVESKTLVENKHYFIHLSLLIEMFKNE